METMRQYIMMSLVLVFTLSANAQSTVSLSGKLLDATNLEALIYASIELKQAGTTVEGTFTDRNGNYIIDDIPVGKYEVIASYVGFESETSVIKITEKQELCFKLKEGVFVCGPIVILAYKPHAGRACWSTQGKVSAIALDEEEGIEVEPEEIVVEEEAIFYPNPTQGPVSFKSEEMLQEMELRDVMGRLIWTKQLKVKQGNIDLSEFQTGYYIVRYGSKGVYKTKKLLKIAG